MKNFIKNNLVIILILTIAADLRFIGTNPGYNKFHSDEPILYGTAMEMIIRGDLNPLRFDYPAGSIFINYLFFKFIFIPLSWVKFFVVNFAKILEGTIHFPISELEMNRIFYVEIVGTKIYHPLFWGRYVVAMFSFGNVFLIYLLVKKLFNKNLGLIASFLVALNFRQVLSAHMNLPDVYNLFFLLLTIIFCIKLWNSPTKLNYLLVGLSSGAAFSMKYQIFSFIPIVLVHLYVSINNKGIDFKKLFSIDKIFITGFSSLLVFLLFNPYILVDYETARMWIDAVSKRYAMGVNKLNFYPFSYLYHYDYGSIQFIFVLIGIVVGLIKYFRKSILLLAIIVPFFFVFVYFSAGGFYVRNFVTITPLVLIFAAIFLYQIFNKSRLAFSVMLFLAILIPFRNSFFSTYYFTKEWSYNKLTNWLYENFPEGETVAAHPFDPPTGSPLMNKTEFEISGSYSVAEHLENDASWALLNSDWAANPFFFWMSYGLADLPKFWNKPMDILRDTFYGLSIEELFRYQVYFVSKVWQAPDEALVLAKLPKWPTVNFVEIKKYSFDYDSQGWSFMAYDEKENNQFSFDNNSIKFRPTESSFSISKVVSPKIKIKPGHLYKIVGFLKSSESIESKKRNAFLRLDFFENENDVKPLITALSSRLYGENKWLEKNIIDRAPENANFIRVGLQFSDSSSAFVSLDDVIISESQEPVDDITQSHPYNIEEIDLNLFYTNSHGNL